MSRPNSDTAVDAAPRSRAGAPPDGYFTTLDADSQSGKVVEAVVSFAETASAFQLQANVASDQGECSAMRCVAARAIPDDIYVAALEVPRLFRCPERPRLNRAPFSRMYWQRPDLPSHFREGRTPNPVRRRL